MDGRPRERRSARRRDPRFAAHAAQRRERGCAARERRTRGGLHCTGAGPFRSDRARRFAALRRGVVRRSSRHRANRAEAQGRSAATPSAAERADRRDPVPE